MKIFIYVCFLFLVSCTSTPVEKSAEVNLNTDYIIVDNHKIFFTIQQEDVRDYSTGKYSVSTMLWAIEDANSLAAANERYSLQKWNITTCNRKFLKEVKKQQYDLTYQQAINYFR